jgi:hypothetical protein
MTQTRIWNFGDTFTSERADTVQGAVHETGVYVGYDISTPDTDKIALSTGFLLLPSGILVGEDVAIELTLSPLPAAATTFTITVRHTDSDVIGGSTAIYALETGELLPAAVTDGVVIGYIRHPGSAVALASSFIFPVRKVLEQAEDAVAIAPTTLVAPFTSTWVVDVIGANTAQTVGFTSPLVTFSRIETDGLGPAPPGFETTTARLPVVAQKFRPFDLVVRAQIDANSELRVSLTDTDGNAVTLTNSVIGPSAIFADFTVNIDFSSGVFTEGDPFLLTLEFRTPQLDSIDVQAVTINYDPLP